MSHPRTQLRQAAVAALTGLPTTGPRVFVDREYSLQPAELPCLHVSTAETTDSPDVFADSLQRSVDLRVRLVAKTTAGMSDLLDQMALEVEGALLGGLVVGGQRLFPESLTAAEPNLAVNGDQPVGEVLMSLNFLVFSPAQAPGSLL